MNARVIIQNARILNIVEKSNDNPNNPITWYEVVFMKDSDVNTVTIDKKLSKLAIDDTYDLELQITEVIKASKEGNPYKQHKFKVVEAYEID